MSISGTVKSIQDIMWKDAGVDGDAQRISQLVWMVFLKVFDDAEAERELMDDGYKSPFPSKLRWRNWAKDPEGITGEALLDFVNNDLFKALKNLPATGKNAALAGVVRSVFEDAFNYMKSGTLMRQVINKLNHIDFNKATDRHQFGDIYETILADLQSAGNAGEFYTPRAVTQFIVDQVDPKLGESILDPACGTGGFLTCAIEHVRKKYVKSAKDEKVLQASIHGVEKKQLPHLLCTTNMLFHGIDVPSNIRHDNTLARPLRDYGPKDRVDVIISNPPFGGMEEDGIENNFPAAFRTRETADLFLVLFLTLLKPGGRAGFVLPDGTLFGEGVKTRIKERLLEEANLHTIVRLPKGVFNPYTGIKTNLLFFTKGEPTKEVWFYEHPYPPGATSYSKTKPLRNEEFAPEKKWWGKRKESEQAWKVSIKDIKDRGYNLDIKNPNAPSEDVGDPVERLAEVRECAAGVRRVREALRAEMGAALKRQRWWTGLNENFDLLAEAPNAVASIRGTILNLAVCGALTSGPESRVVAGDSRPFILPESWQWKSGRDVFEFVTSGSRGWAQHYSADGAAFLRIGNLDYESIELDLREVQRVSPPDGAEGTRTRVRVGDILISITGDTGMVGLVRDGIGDAYINQHIALARPVSGLMPEYLARALTAPAILGAVQRAQRGIKNSLGLEDIRELFLPIPPMAEQKRIVTLVRRLDALCNDLERGMKAKAETAGRLASALVAASIA